MIVIPLDSAGERHGVLLVADRANHRIDTEKAELLELLAGQAAGSLRMAAAVTELRERAAARPADRPRPPRHVLLRGAGRAGRPVARAGAASC